MIYSLFVDPSGFAHLPVLRYFSIDPNGGFWYFCVVIVLPEDEESYAGQYCESFIQ
jgi:hypothetical protein